MRTCMFGRGAVCLLVGSSGSSVWSSGRCGTLMTSSRGFNVDGRAEASRSCAHAFVVGAQAHMDLARAGSGERMWRLVGGGWWEESARGES